MYSIDLAGLQRESAVYLLRHLQRHYTAALLTIKQVVAGFLSQAMCLSLVAGFFQILGVSKVIPSSQTAIVLLRRMFALGVFLSSMDCNAHVRWFIEDSSDFAARHYHLDALTIALIVGAVSYILLSVIVEHKNSLLSRKALLESGVSTISLAAGRTPLSLASFNNFLHWFLKASLAVLFIGNLIQGHFIAPHFGHASSGAMFEVVQGGLIVLLVVDGAWAGAALMLVSLLLPAFGSPAVSVDYMLELFSLGAAIFCTSPRLADNIINFGFHRFEFRVRAGAFGLAVLRMGLGAQLIILTLHDKLLSPALGLAFLERFPEFNFVRMMGMESMTNLHFVLAAGLAEFCFGICLLFNLACRFTLSLVMLCFTVSGLVLGLAELIGHIPIMAAVFVLLVSPAKRYFEFSLGSRRKDNEVLSMLRVNISR